MTSMEALSEVRQLDDTQRRHVLAHLAGLVPDQVAAAVAAVKASVAATA